MSGKSFNLSKGVFSFNGRKGNIIPDPKDYPPEMIGALSAIEDESNPGCFYQMVDGVKEWINPPMVLGVEYRTIERYMGNPVYVMLADFGALPNNTTKSIVFSDTTVKVFSVSGRAIVKGQAYTLPVTDEAILWCGGGSKINIKTTTDYSHWTAYIWLKYTK